MNYLIHAYITIDHPRWNVGNIIADLMGPKDLRTIGPSLKKGVMLHRRIDSFSDQHLRVKNSVSLLRKDHGKYAAVAVDLLYDYLLSQSWDKYSDRSFQSVVHATYKHLNVYINLIPSNIRPVIHKMIEGKWLNDYQSEDGFRRVLQRMDRRAAFSSEFARLLENLDDDRALFEQDFNGFFPELKEQMELRMEEMK